jgi:hypothetical protein
MKRFFGSLLVTLGVLACLSLLMPAPGERDVHWVRFHQATLTAAFLCTGWLLSRKPQPAS